MYDYLDLRQTERLKELVPYKALAPDADEIIEELDRLNNIIEELEKWLNEYYKSNRKWYNTELSNHDKQYYGEVYRNTEFMIVKFKKQLKALKENK